MESSNTFTWLLVGAFILRLMIMLYGEWQDHNMKVKFTDIDYSVFTDAAEYVYHGLLKSLGQEDQIPAELTIVDGIDPYSPYQRATYRYTPLLAWLMVPNHALNAPFFGKLCFISFDIIVALCLKTLLLARRRKETSGAFKSLTVSELVSIAVFWLFNPMVFVISARGNAESIISGVILLSLVALSKGNITSSAIMLGLAVHFKIYPVLYGWPMVLSINKGSGRLITTERLSFFLISATTFFTLNALMLYLYGSPFLNETYLYHVTRKDHRHNFSIYFYHLYLTFNSNLGFIVSLSAFLPQVILVFVFGLLFSDNVPFACFLQTFAFVMFNKVCTSQYFLWYICFLPVIVSDLSMSIQTGIMLIGAWFGGQAIWLKYAYDLEFLGQSTFFELWIAGCIFFIINTVILGVIIHSYKGTREIKSEIKRE